MAKADIPSFDDVSEAWKAPFGPYRQAPEEYGSKWYKVNPWTGPEPWKQAVAPTVGLTLPSGFEDIFGPRPQGEDFRDEINPSRAFRVATVTWQQDLKYFKQAGAPEWLDDETLELIEDTTELWDMGVPYLYEGRYGWMARFPEAAPYVSFETTAWALANAVHQVVANFQIKLLQNELIPAVQHPFVPPRLFD